ncbi:hypothetical protein FOZ63_030540 [Perkinsus olseni]|uniref:N-acetyltransferase domain-containing protein n=2 Tax=Perkinsus olseni TaxID=32597 RepID=A0A7J6R4V4_PEROL|nr:hypothetical protein FOZ63_030540 [Perkinsus olseni]KAF4718369.1 hypothetical protein FOZ62_028481 [Perkinsus olseni]
MASCAIPPLSAVVILMIVHHRRGPLVLLALMIPSSILSLTSHKQKDSITLDQFEYRLAKPSDVFLGEKGEPDAAVFVAAEPGKGVVVASVEFGLVKGGDHWDFVGLPSLRVKEDWRGRRVGSELLKELVKYVGRSDYWKDPFSVSLELEERTLESTWPLSDNTIFAKMLQFGTDEFPLEKVKLWYRLDGML